MDKIQAYVYHDHGSKYIEWSGDDNVVVKNKKIDQAYDTVCKFAANNDFPTDDIELNKRFNKLWNDYIDTIIEECNNRDDVVVEHERTAI